MQLAVASVKSPIETRLSGLGQEGGGPSVAPATGGEDSEAKRVVIAEAADGGGDPINKRFGGGAGESRVVDHQAAGER
jgi:hypothetical protein